MTVRFLHLESQLWSTAFDSSGSESGRFASIGRDVKILKR